MQRRIRVLVAVLALLVAAAPLTECLVDESVPSQMACCAAMDHDCGAVGMDAGCCPTGGSDRGQLSASAAPQVHPAPVASPGVAGWALPPDGDSKVGSAFEAFNREILKLPERPTYLLVSTFLI